MQAAQLPALPPLAGRLLQAVPPVLVAWPLQRVTLSFARRHREVFARLGCHATQAYLIDPLDLPFAFRLRPRPARPTIEVLHRPVARGWDARIAGRLSALLGMVHGALDGDALFFSRDLKVTGDTEAVVALRNALDDIDGGLVQAVTRSFGPLSPVAAMTVSHFSSVGGRSSHER